MPPRQHSVMSALSQVGLDADAVSVERHGLYTKLRLSDTLHVWLSSGRGRWAMVVRLGDDGALHVYPNLRTAHKQLEGHPDSDSDSDKTGPVFDALAAEPGNAAS